MGDDALSLEEGPTMTEDFACANAPLGCDGRVSILGATCAGPCGCRAVDHEVMRLIENIDDVADVRVGRVAGGVLAITVLLGNEGELRPHRFGEFQMRHRIHMAITTSLHESDVARGHPYSLVIQ